MKNKIVFLAILLLFVPLAAHAQSGCGDSPENPTYLLAMLGVGSAIATTFYSRIFPK